MVRKKIFISYSRLDTAYVTVLVEALRKHDFVVWFDKNIRIGVDWDNAIEAQLKMADLIVLVLSKSSVESENVKDEVSYAIGLGKPINPIKIEACEVPMRLARKQFIDFTVMGDEAGFESLVHELRKDQENYDKGSEISKGSFISPNYTRSATKPSGNKRRKIITVSVAIVAALVIMFFIVTWYDSPGLRNQESVLEEKTMGNPDIIWDEDSLNRDPNQYIISGTGAIADPNTEDIENYNNGLSSNSATNPAWEKALATNSVDGWLDYLKHLEYDQSKRPAEEAILSLMPKRGLVRVYDRDSFPNFSRLKYYNSIGEVIVKEDKNDIEYADPGDVLIAKNMVEFVWDIVDDNLMSGEYIRMGEKVFVLEQDFGQPEHLRLRIAYSDK